MGLVDTYIVYRFVRLLTTPWDETDAFREGVIDGNGKLLIDTDKMTDKQSDAYTLFDRLVYNIKRLIEKIPGGKSKIGTYAAAMYLFKEQMGDEEGRIVLERSFMSYLKENDALEGDYLAEQFKPEETLPQGNYRVLNTMMDVHGNLVQKGTIVISHSNQKPTAKVLGIDVYALKTSTGKTVVVSHEDISEI
jgi:hypothetical protein